VAVSKELVFSWIEEWVREFLHLPAIAKGVVSAPRKGWIWIGYRDAVTGRPVRLRNPSVVAGAIARTGWISPPEITLPRYTVTVPTVPEPDWEEIRRTVEEAYKSLYKASWPWTVLDFWPFNAIRDWLASNDANKMVDTLRQVYDRLLKPQVDLVSRGIEDTINTASDKIASGIEHGINMAVEKVWEELLKLTKGVLPTILPIRNIREDGFEVYAPEAGVKIYYVAIGCG